MVIVNFSHPLVPDQLAEIERIAGQPVARVIEVKAQFDPAALFAEQTRAMVANAGLSGEEWQTTRLIVNLPSLNVIAGLLLAELHGRMGYFPTVLRLKPAPGSTPPRFDVAEVINLQAVRDGARALR